MWPVRLTTCCILGYFQMLIACWEKPCVDTSSDVSVLKRRLQTWEPVSWVRNRCGDGFASASAANNDDDGWSSNVGPVAPAPRREWRLGGEVAEDRSSECRVECVAVKAALAEFCAVEIVFQNLMQRSAVPPPEASKPRW